MTTIRIKIDEVRVRVEISGHAGYNRGNDIVCAGVSILSSTLDQSVQKFISLGQIDKVNERKHEKGITCLDFDIPKEPKDIDNVNVMLSVIVTGFELIVERYPNHVQMELDY